MTLLFVPTGGSKMNSCLEHLTKKISFPESDFPTCHAEENTREWEERYGDLTVWEFIEKRERGELSCGQNSIVYLLVLSVVLLTVMLNSFLWNLL